MEESPNSECYSFQDHSSSSEYDEEPDTIQSQASQRPRQRRPGDSSLLPTKHRPVRQPKPPRWMATGDWLL